MLKSKRSWAWGYAPVIPATQAAEVGGSLVPGIQGQPGQQQDSFPLTGI